MKRFLVVFAWTAGLLCLGGTQAQATPSSSDVSWSYTFTPSNAPTTTNPVNNPFVSADSPGHGTAVFQSTGASTYNSGNVVVTNVHLSSTDPGQGDVFKTNGAWQTGLVITDKASGDKSGTLYLTGQLSGHFGSGISNVSNIAQGAMAAAGSGWVPVITNGQPAGYSWTDPTNGDKYTVGMPASGTQPFQYYAFTNPGPPTDATGTGGVSSYVTVVKGNGSVNTASTPEPSTLVLSFLGLTFAGASSWRKRRTLAAKLA